MSEYEVWGYTIETSPSGKRIWPKKLKLEATRRIREDGMSPGDVAAEIGAHECLVRKWWVADRRMRGETISVGGPTFAEIAVETDRPTPAPMGLDTQPSSMARLHIGTLCIEFPVGIAEEDLLKILRVAGQAS